MCKWVCVIFRKGNNKNTILVKNIPNIEKKSKVYHSFYFQTDYSVLRSVNISYWAT